MATRLLVELHVRSSVMKRKKDENNIQRESEDVFKDITYPSWTTAYYDTEFSEKKINAQPIMLK